MKLNPDYVRDILLYMEEWDFREAKDMSDIYAKFPKIAEGDLHYTCIKMEEGGLIEATVRNYPVDNGKVVITIKDITYSGHQFLANIHEDTIWNGVKGVAKRVGATSLSAIAQIASQTVATLIKNQFGIPT